MRFLAVVGLVAASAFAEPQPSPQPPPAAAPAANGRAHRAWRIAAYTTLVGGVVLASIGAPLLALNATCSTNAPDGGPCPQVYETTVAGATLAAFGAAGVVLSIPFFVLGYRR